MRNGNSLYHTQEAKPVKQHPFVSKIVIGIFSLLGLIVVVLLSDVMTAGQIDPQYPNLGWFGYLMMKFSDAMRSFVNYS